MVTRLRFLQFFILLTATALASAQLSSSSTSSTIASLPLFDSFGYPIIHVLSNSGDSSSTVLSSAFSVANVSYTPTNFGGSVPGSASFQGILGITASLVMQYGMSSTSSSMCVLNSPPIQSPRSTNSKSAQNGNFTANGYYAGKILLMNRGGSCTDHDKALLAQNAGASLLLLVGCPTQLPGGPTGSGTVSGHCGLDQMLNSTTADPSVEIHIPILLISTVSATTLQSFTSAAQNFQLFIAGAGIVAQQDWDALRDLASNVSFPSTTDAFASGTRPFTDLLPSPSSNSNSSLSMRSFNLNYGLDPCLVRVRGIWCINSRVVMINLKGLAIDPPPSSGRSANLLPASVKSLTALRVLNLGSCRLQGSIPSGLLNAIPTLVYVDLSNQVLAGDIEGSIDTTSTAPVSAIQYLDVSTNALSSNQLSDAFMSKLASPSLRSLNVMNNFIGGILPASLSSASNLESLQLDYNKLSGPLDPTGSMWTALPHMKVLTMEYCNFTGSIPVSVGSMSALTMLSMGHNHFTGDMPEAVYGLNQLQFFSVSTNFLTGTISPSIKGWKDSMNTLRVSANRFVGDLPTELGFLTKLNLLHVHSNAFTSLPDSLSNLKLLKAFWSDTNQIQGRVFEKINPSINWPAMQVMRFSNNLISGPLPNMKGMQSLTEATMDNNQMDGCIGTDGSWNQELPLDFFDQLPKLQTFSVSKNILHFSSSIPNFAQSGQLTIMDFSSNALQVAGVNPNWNLPKLQILRLNNNNINGNGNLGNMAFSTPMLQEINLSNNGITMPVGMQDIGSFIAQLPTSIIRIFMSHNQLAGPLTAYLDRLGFSNLNQLILDHNLITDVAPHIFYNAIPSATVIDLSYNQINSNNVISITQPVFTLSTIKLEGNPLLVSSLSPPLPTWLTASTTYTKATLDQRYSCPILTGSTRPMSVTLDPEFYQYEFCVCDWGTSGQAPDCQPIPNTVDFTANAPTDATHSAFQYSTQSIGSFDGKTPVVVGSLSDSMYGNKRLTSGMDILWVIGEMSSNLTSSTTNTYSSSLQLVQPRRVRAIYLDLQIDPRTFNQIHDTLFIYAGSIIESSEMESSIQPLEEIYGSSYASFNSLSTSANDSVNVDTASIPYVSKRIMIPSSKATLNFRSKSFSGEHFLANWSISYDCPAGYHLVQGRFTGGLSLTTDQVEAIDANDGGSICLTLFSPDSKIQLMIYVISGIVALANIVTLVLFAMWRNKLIIRTSNVALSIQILIWNTVISVSAIFFAIDPNPYSQSSLPQGGDWQCRARPWPIALGVMGILSGLLTKANTIKNIFGSSKLSVLKMTKTKMLMTSWALLSIQVALLIIYSALPLSQLELAQGSGVLGQQYIFQCSSLSSSGSAVSTTSSHMSYSIWLGVQFMIFGGFIIASLSVAWQNRNAPFAYNESQYTTLSMACICLLAMITIALNFIVEGNPNQVMAIRGLGINIGSFVLLAVLFFPKLYYIFTGLGDERIMTQCTKSEIDEEIANEVAAAVTMDSIQSDKSDGGSGGDGAAGATAANGATSNSPQRRATFLDSPGSNRPSRVGRPSTCHRLSQTFVDKQLSLHRVSKIGIAPSYEHERSVSVSHCALPPIQTTRGRHASMADPPSVSRASRQPSVSRSTVAKAASHNPTARHSININSQGNTTTRPFPVVGNASTLKRIDSKVNLPSSEAIEPISSTELLLYIQKNESDMKTTFSKWKDDYDQEHASHMASVVAACVAHYDTLLKDQERNVTSLQTRVRESVKAMDDFNAWIVNLLKAAPDTAEARQHKQFFEQLKPNAKLLQPMVLRPISKEIVKTDPFQSHLTSPVFKMSEPPAIGESRSRATAAPSSPTLSLPNSSTSSYCSTNVTPDTMSSLSPTDSLTSSWPSICISAASTTSLSPNSLLASATPDSSTTVDVLGSPQLVKRSDIFHIQLQHNQRKAMMKHLATAASNNPGTDTEDEEKEQEVIQPLSLAPKVSARHGHKRDLSSSIPANIANQLNSSNGLSNSTPVNFSNPTARVSGRASMSIPPNLIGSSMQLIPNMKKQPRRKTICEKQNNGLGETGIFLQYRQELEEEEQELKTAEEAKNAPSESISNLQTAIAIQHKPTSALTSESMSVLPPAISKIVSKYEKRCFVMRVHPQIEGSGNRALSGSLMSPEALLARKQSQDRLTHLYQLLELDRHHHHHHPHRTRFTNVQEILSRTRKDIETDVETDAESDREDSTCGLRRKQQVRKTSLVAVASAAAASAVPETEDEVATELTSALQQDQTSTVNLIEEASASELVTVHRPVRADSFSQMNIYDPSTSISPTESASRTQAEQIVNEPAASHKSNISIVLEAMEAENAESVEFVKSVTPILSGDAKESEAMLSMSLANLNTIPTEPKPAKARNEPHHPGHVSFDSNASSLESFDTHNIADGGDLTDGGYAADESPHSNESSYLHSRRHSHLEMPQPHHHEDLNPLDLEEESLEEGEEEETDELLIDGPTLARQESHHRAAVDKTPTAEVALVSPSFNRVINLSNSSLPRVRSRVQIHPMRSVSSATPSSTSNDHL